MSKASVRNETRRRPRLRRAAVALVGAASLAAFVGTPAASAETQTSWTGSTPSLNGVLYLHNSSITNDPAIVANSTIYTAFGGTVPPGQMGVRARLFKSGVLCIANNYTSNSGFVNSLNAPTSGYCGPGSYNSHGYVRAWNGTGFSEYFTFPSNPVWSLDSAARSATPDQAEPESGTNAQGQTYGSGADAASDAELPDLVAAYGTGGELGYIKSSAITASAATVEEVTPQATATSGDGSEVFVSGPDTTPLYAQDGTTVVGMFDLN